MGNLQSEVRRLRKLKDWTQEELAQKLFVQPHTVTQWETGKRSLTVDMFEKILEVMELTMKINDEWLQMAHSMKQVKDYLLEEKVRLKKQSPTWEVKNTGGKCFTLSKNLPTLKGDTVGVWIGGEGVVLRQLSDEEGFATVEEYREINDSLEEVILLVINGEGKYDIEPMAKEMFTDETIQELMEKSISLNK